MPILTNVSQRTTFTFMKDKQVAIRLPGTELERAARLVKALGTQPAYAGLDLTTSHVLRMAIARGLDALEAEGKKGGR